MLKQEITELARRTIQVRFNDYHKQLVKDIAQIKEEMNVQGALFSSATLRRVYDRCAQEVEIRVNTAWLTLREILSVAGMQPSEELASDLKKEVEGYLPQNLPELTQIVEQTADMVRYHSEEFSLDHVRNHALEKVGTEIDLYVLSLRSRAEEEGTHIEVPTQIEMYNFLKLNFCPFLRTL